MSVWKVYNLSQKTCMTKTLVAVVVLTFFFKKYDVDKLVRNTANK